MDRDDGCFVFVAGDALKATIADYEVVGIRSVTQLNKEVIESAKHLIAIGCFCIGTNQVDLKEAETRAIPVFNSPFSNSRSVAELIIAHVVNLSRFIGDQTMRMHRGEWNKVILVSFEKKYESTFLFFQKSLSVLLILEFFCFFCLFCFDVWIVLKIQSAVNCHEVRGKTIGIVGYGHVGSQVSVLAESMGMRVVFYDVVPKMPLGSSSSCQSLEDLLVKADFVTLHVPELPTTVVIIFFCFGHTSQIYF